MKIEVNIIFSSFGALLYTLHAFVSDNFVRNRLGKVARLPNNFSRFAYLAKVCTRPDARI